MKKTCITSIIPVLVAVFMVIYGQRADAESHTQDWLAHISTTRPEMAYFRSSPFASVVSRTYDGGCRTAILKTDAANISRLKAAAEQEGYSVSVQPNFVYRALVTPNDLSYPFQWHLTTSNVSRAWDFDTTTPLYGGDPSVIVAVLDTGASFEAYQTYGKAPDFATTNFTTGYDFVNNDDHPNDDNGHGTHVTMAIAESTGNTIAGAGIAFNVTIMPIKVLDAEGYGSTATIAAGVDFARLHGARVINLSLGGTEDDPILHTAIQHAVTAGITVVSATGNDGVGTIYYPAQYDEVIAVGAVRYDESRSHFSNYGTGIDLVAPGGDLDVDQNSDGYPDGILQETCTSQACNEFDDFFYEGTSQAAPQVSATAALLISAGIDATHISAILQASAKDLGVAGYDTTFGWGLLDVAQAMTIGVNDATAPTGTISLNDGNAYARASEVTLGIAALDVGSSVTSMSFSNNGTSFSSWEPYATSQTWDMNTGYGASSADGSKTVYARFRDAAGNVSATTSDQIVLDTVQPVTPTFLAHAPPPYQAVKAVSGVPTSLKSPIVEWSSTDITSGIAGYRVEYTTDAETNFQGGTIEAVQSYPMQSFSVSTTAYLRVVAVDNAGNQSSVATFAYVYRVPRIILGISSSTGSTVVVSELNGKASLRAMPYGKKYTYGVNVTTAVTEAGKAERVIVSALRGQSKVKVLNSKGATLNEFAPYGTSAKLGINVSQGDTDADGASDLIITPLQGRLPLRLFTIDGKKIGEWYPYGSSFSKGFTAALLHTSDATYMVTAPRSGSPLIRVFSMKGTLLHQWYAFSKKATFGLNIATGDVNADGDDEIVVAPIEGAPQVKVYSRNKKLLSQFFAYPKTSRTGVSIAVIDLVGNGKDAIIATPAKGTARLKCIDMKGKTVTKCKTASALPSGTITIAGIK